MPKRAAGVAVSGRQVELRYGDQRAVVVEVGGGLREYWKGERALLDGYRTDEVAPDARGQLLAPWPNRLHGGQYDWDGSTHQVPLDEPDQQNALHGLVRWRSWTADDVSESAVTMQLTLRAQPAYPFELELQTRYELGPDGLVVSMRSTNIGDSDAPFGCGAHPYLTAGTPTIDECDLRLAAEEPPQQAELAETADQRAVDPALDVRDRGQVLGIPHASQHMAS